ncbi:unnamed protein product, partial [Rotaria magnacalcarata]
MGEKLIEDDPNEWLKDNVECFIRQAHLSHSHNHNNNINDCNDNITKSTDLIHLMLDATEKNSTDTNQ